MPEPEARLMHIVGPANTGCLCSTFSAQYKVGTAYGSPMVSWNFNDVGGDHTSRWKKVVRTLNYGAVGTKTSEWDYATASWTDTDSNVAAALAAYATAVASNPPNTETLVYDSTTQTRTTFDKDGNVLGTDVDVLSVLVTIADVKAVAEAQGTWTDDPCPWSTGFFIVCDYTNDTSGGPPVCYCFGGDFFTGNICGTSTALVVQVASERYTGLTSYIRADWSLNGKFTQQCSDSPLVGCFDGSYSQIGCTTVAHDGSAITFNPPDDEGLVTIWSPDIAMLCFAGEHCDAAPYWCILPNFTHGCHCPP